MANQPESASYDAGVYQLEVVDSVDGGVGAKSNAPLLSLANRTAYLKSHLDALEAGTFVPNGFALLNSPSFTGSPTGPTQAAGDNTTKLATTAFVQTTVNGTVSVDISGAATTTLTQPQYGPAIIKLTGSVTANKAVVFPNISGHWQVVNNSTGAFTVTLKTAAGTGVVISTGMSSNIYCDGTNVTLQQTDFISLALTGSPTVPTAAPGTNNFQIANTAFVQAAVTALVASSPAALDTLKELAVALGNDPNFATTMTNALASKQPNLGYIPVQAGTGVGQNSNLVKIGWSTSSKIKVTIDTTDVGNVAMESWITSNYAPLASPALTGFPSAPTASGATNNTQIATTAFVQTAVAGKQASLGYTPVQQGTGVGQVINAVKIGWDGGSKIKVSIDATDFGALALESSFARNMSAIGWQKLAGGTIIQWGYNVTDSTGASFITFPLAFPNDISGMTVSGRWNSPTYALNAGINAKNNTNALIYTNFNGAGISAGFDWIAIGY